jgi:hypothetical protein
MTDWILVTENTELHGDDSLKLEMEYTNVPIADVKTHSYQAIYTLPDWMKGDAQEAEPFYDSTGLIQCGTQEVTEDSIKFSYDQTWLDGQSGIYLNGILTLEAVLNPSAISGSQLSIGDLILHVNYDGDSDWNARYGTIDIEKSEATYIEQTDDYDLLEYTLTVICGDEPMEDIVIKDAFENASTENYIQEIVGVTDQKTTLPTQVFYENPKEFPISPIIHLAPSAGKIKR